MSSPKTSPKKKKAATSKSATKAQRAELVRDPFVTDDPRTAWTHFRAEALALASASRVICSADPDLVRSNVARGVASVLPQVAQARAALPTTDVTRALESKALSLALTHAIDLVLDVPDAVSTEAIEDLDAGLTVGQRTAKMYKDRYALMLQLKVFASLGVYSEEALKMLLAGSGAIDGARDVLQADAALDGEGRKHPFTPEWRQRATTRARRLLSELTPTNAPTEAPVRTPSSLERDAYWTLLLAAHAELRKIGMVLFGERDLDEKVPPLQSRTATKAKPDETKKP